MKLTPEQREILERYSSLEEIPESERRYKCYNCNLIVDESPCPVCGEKDLEIMCPLDHCHCNHPVVGRIEYCPLCGRPVCPECGSHDVSQVSRVTGYLADVAGWNAAKKQELKDRTRYMLV
ncbi:MAG: anaerobic ribonucleoside-triphosphate reductase [Methanoculleaceae archaeon]